MTKRYYYLIAFLTSFTTFIVFSFINWYQGSALAVSFHEWKYTAKFSYLFGNPMEPKDISQLDYFVYSAKHYPILTLIMLISLFFVAFSLIKLRKSSPAK
ncbi:DUF4306 domain-containing protein [Bacillus sp. B-jedd]|uniref:DUF4306 domain-containing protein n=1 Tax=Bacillus sp. B-jedd TaxID=1476857 RepID=UPI0005156CDB|nr:DUF4306 domain-containing protein [Bacillus sp. B-jedd]CEG28967.1 YjdJ [Bacillus sp. B-jedd]